MSSGSMAVRYEERSVVLQLGQVFVETTVPNILDLGTTAGVSILHHLWLEGIRTIRSHCDCVAGSILQTILQCMGIAFAVIL